MIAVEKINNKEVKMKFEDKFTLPSEWISDESKQIVESCREIVEKEIFPVGKNLMKIGKIIKFTRSY